MSSFSQDDELEWNLEIDSSLLGETLCETFENMANRDVKRGLYIGTYYVFKYNDSNTFERLMFRKYGVHAVRIEPCDVGVEADYFEFPECYGSISNPVIKELFGADVFEKTMREADSLDRIGLGDRETYYSEGLKKLKKQIYKEFDSKIIKQYGPKDDFPSPTITLHVDENGKIYDCGIRFCQNQIITAEFKRILPNLPQMVFGTKDGKAVKDSIIFSLPINRKEFRKN